jgi:competence protein ComGC
MQKPTYNKGLTLLELIIILIIVGVFTLFTIVALGDAQEQQDAKAFNTVQATLQGVVLQGAQRTTVKPHELSADTVIAAMPPQPSIVLTQTAKHEITATTQHDRPRRVTFTTNPCGDVCMTGLWGFTAFRLQPLPTQACKESAFPDSTTVVHACNYLAGL